MKQLSHDVRIVYIDNSDDSLQNCYNHQFKIDNPSTYTSMSINLVENSTQSYNNINYLYISSDNVIRITFNGSNDVVCQHLSFINMDQSFSIHISNNDISLLANEIQLMYGTIQN